jgi:hypothetical protein
MFTIVETDDLKSRVNASQVQAVKVVGYGYCNPYNIKIFILLHFLSLIG